MKFLNRLSVGFSLIEMTNTLHAYGMRPKLTRKMSRNSHFADSFLLRVVLLLVLAWPVLGWGQVNLLMNAGKSYINTDSRTFDEYPVIVNGCSTVNFSITYNFSLPFTGFGSTMESSGECTTCSGDPNNPDELGCNGIMGEGCWDFFWVRFMVNGVEVGSELIGTSNLTQANTVPLNNIPVNPGDRVSIEV